jgi:hypothetical protein
MSTATMEFDKIKLFKTDYRFKNEKESDKFFDDVLVKSTAIYMKDLERSMDEKIHVSFSRQTILKYASYSFLVLTLFALAMHAPIFGAALLGISFLSMLLSRILKSKTDDLVMAKDFTLSMLYSDNLEYLEGVRKDLIEGNI